MILFWLAALIPITVGGLLWCLGDKINWREWVISTVIALVMATVFQFCATLGMTKDVETWSGQVNHVRQYSAWTEYYEHAIYRTETYPAITIDGDGDMSVELRTREVFDHWEAREEQHPAHWRVFTTLGDWEIDPGNHGRLCKQFGGLSTFAGERITDKHNSKMVGGDPNDYTSVNKTGWVEPVTITKTFKNRVKAAPSSFSFSKVPTNAPVFAWPSNPNHFVSDRVMGEAKKNISTLKWDQMNAKLGPTKKVNLIIIGFGEQDPKIAEWQEAAWIGGKKNDLVLCYGTTKLEDGGQGVAWTKVFGWTEKENVKENLAVLLKEFPVNNDLIPRIQEEVIKNYTIKDWKKFDRLTIEPPAWAYWVYFSIFFVVQGGLFWLYNANNLNKNFMETYYEDWWGKFWPY